MELNLFEDRRYFVTWTGEELEGRGKARLVFQPVQCMGGGPAGPVELTVYPARDFRPRRMDVRLPDGLYRCFLADAGSGAPLTPAREVFFGQRQRVELYSQREQGGFRRFTILSPLPLREGDCGLDYGVFGTVPLPEAERSEERYRLSFLLRPRRTLPVKLRWAEHMKKVLTLPEKLEDASGWR